MNRKLAIVLATLAGAFVLVNVRRYFALKAEAELWAAATDH